MASVDTSSAKGLDSHYDFVVVGGGTTGLAADRGRAHPGAGARRGRQPSRRPTDHRPRPRRKHLLTSTRTTTGASPPRHRPGSTGARWRNAWERRWAAPPRGSLSSPSHDAKSAQQRAGILGRLASISAWSSTRPSPASTPGREKLGNKGWAWDDDVEGYVPGARRRAGRGVRAGGGGTAGLLRERGGGAEPAVQPRGDAHSADGRAAGGPARAGAPAGRGRMCWCSRGCGTRSVLGRGLAVAKWRAARGDAGGGAGGGAGEVYAALSCVWHGGFDAEGGAGGVVDAELKVCGVLGLRVDASIFPLVPRGNIQTSVFAVAEKAADLLKGG